MTYDYHCNNCKLDFEIEQKIVDNALQDCPYCNVQKCLNKIISTATFILKGKDWPGKTS